ncbi:MAG: sulfatase [Planctomycetota bacterium]
MSYFKLRFAGWMLIASALFAPTSSAESPNFVVILTDDQSWVGTSLQLDPEDSRTRSDYFRTPNIERLAKRGMTFSRGYAPAPYCCPTRRSLVIGQTPARHVYQKDQPGWAKRYRDQLSLPKMLKAADPEYRTAHFGKWDSRYDGVSPEQMGYDVSDGKTGNGTGGANGTDEDGATDDPKLAFSVTDRAGRFMQKQAESGRPFFVQVSHYAVHLGIFYRQSTLNRTREWKKGKRHTLPKFAAMTADVDDAIGKLIDRIDTLGLKQTTYIFFLSDNGGRLTMSGQKNAELPRNSPLRDGKGTVYEGGIRIPFIVCGPEVPPLSHSRVAVTGLDLFPTIAELAGYQPELPSVIDGGSLMPVFRNHGVGVVNRPKPFLFFHQAVSRTPQSALMLGKYKLVRHWEADTLELFDLANDIGESQNLAESLPAKRDELSSMMDTFLDEVGAERFRTTTKPELYKLFK